MIPYFKSQYFNMNFDEPVELGKGKNKEYVDEHGEANCYLEYFKVLCDEVKSYHKTPMLWGDVLIKHPESLKDIPKDVIFIDWGYDHKYDFRTHAAMLKENNVPFMTAPGTITWGTVVGKDIDMFGSIKHSADAAKEYGGLGILITDWGDFGHLQYLPASLPGFIYGACMAWSSIEEESFVGALGRFLPDLATVIMKLSCYSSIDEYRSYGNKLFTPIIYSEHASRYKEDHLEYFLDSMKSNIVSSEVYDAYKDFFNKIKIKLLDKEENIFRDELLNSTELLLLLNEIDYKIGMYIDNQEVSFDDEIDRLDSYKEEHYKLWIKRNKEAGYYLSVKRIEWLKNILMELNRKERK